LCLSGPVAVGTSLAAILVNSSYALFKRRGAGTVDAKLTLPVAGGSLAGVWLGVTLLVYLKHLPPININDREIVAVQYVLLCAFIVVLTWIAGFMLYDYHRTHGEAPPVRIGALAKMKLPLCCSFESLEGPAISLLALALVGMVVGFATGLMGIGGGVIYLPVLVYLVGQRTANAAGTSLLLVWFSAAIGVALNWRADNIHWLLFTALIAGGLGGTFLGTKIGLKMTGPKIRQYFVYVLVAAIALVAYEVLRLTFGPVQ
jgi:uncharacterized membrane protein YfcA